MRAGEIFGIAGIVGAGRTELVRAIAGADPVASGTIEVNGKTVQIKIRRRDPQRHRARAGGPESARGLILSQYDRR